MRFTSLLVVLLSASMLFGVQTSAQTGLQISPAIIEVPLTSETVRRDIRVTNFYGEPVAVEVEIRSLVPQDQVTESGIFYDARESIELETESFLLDLEQTKEYGIKISKGDFPEGSGSYALLVFRIRGVGDVVGSGVRVNTEVAAVVLLTSPGQPNESFEVVVDEPETISISGPVTFTGFFENTGTVHALPILKLQLLDGQGVVIAEETRSESLILPGTRRFFEFKPEKQIGRGVFTVKAQIQYGNTGERKQYTTGDFRIVGRTTVIAIVGTTVVLVIVGAVGARRVRRRLVSKHKL